jgi:hypothetical protein
VHAWTGESAETEFCRLTRARKLPRGDKRGDAVFEGTVVEIKSVESERYTNLNQVRVLKMSTLVVRRKVDGGWYVIPAIDVWRKVVPFERGHHTEIAFECAHLDLKAFRSDLIPPTPEALVDATRAAIAETERHRSVKQLMAELDDEIKALRDRYKDKAEALLGTEKRQ